MLSGQHCVSRDYVNKIIRSCAVDTKINWSKTVNWEPPLRSKIQLFWHSWQGVISLNIFLRYVANLLHNQFYKIKIRFQFRTCFQQWIVAKTKCFQCKQWSFPALRHKYPYIGLHTRCIMGYAQIVYWYYISDVSRFKSIGGFWSNTTLCMWGNVNRDLNGIQYSFKLWELRLTRFVLRAC